MGRLCALLDPSVHVIYISPCPLRDEVLDYQVRLVIVLNTYISYTAVELLCLAYCSCSMIVSAGYES
jgi:hypothetical protein